MPSMEHLKYLLGVRHELWHIMLLFTDWAWNEVTQRKRHLMLLLLSWSAMAKVVPVQSWMKISIITTHSSLLTTRVPGCWKQVAIFGLLRKWLLDAGTFPTDWPSLQSLISIQKICMRRCRVWDFGMERYFNILSTLLLHNSQVGFLI